MKWNELEWKRNLCSAMEYNETECYKGNENEEKRKGVASKTK